MWLWKKLLDLLNFESHLQLPGQGQTKWFCRPYMVQELDFSQPWARVSTPVTFSKETYLNQGKLVSLRFRRMHTWVHTCAHTHNKKFREGTTFLIFFLMNWFLFTVNYKPSYLLLSGLMLWTEVGVLQTMSLIISQDFLAQFALSW